MKKVLFTLALCAFSLGSIAQTKKMDLSRKDIGPLRPALYKQEINMETGDTIKYVILLFQNVRYSAITDTKSILFLNPHKDDSTIKQFIADLKSAQAESDKGVDMTWEQPMYNVRVKESDKAVYLIDPTGTTGYTYLTQRQTQMLLDWLSSIGFN
jgi:hypothetical protein